MRFTLWGPKQKSSIVRIYLEHADAYIWRKSTKHKLEIGGSEAYLKDNIRFFLNGLGIDLESLPSRRSLAKILHEKNLLIGDYRKYMGSFIEEPNRPMEKRTAKIINFADFKRR